jgi:hypothetical protein
MRLKVRQRVTKDITLLWVSLCPLSSTRPTRLQPPTDPFRARRDPQMAAVTQILSSFAASETSPRPINTAARQNAGEEPILPSLGLEDCHNHQVLSQLGLGSNTT